MLNGFGKAEEIEMRRSQLEQSHGVQVGYHPADPTKPDEILDLVQTTANQLGGVDILVNNAGMQVMPRVYLRNEQKPVPSGSSSLLFVHLLFCFYLFFLFFFFSFFFLFVMSCS